jgi:hypothetical protein
VRQIAAGSLVKHRKLGTGKVVAVEPLALHVFFPGSDTRYAAKLRWPDAGNFLSQEELAPDPWLEGLTSFALDAISGRYALAANFLSQDEAVEAFLAENGDAFQDAPPRKGALRLDRGARWRAAATEWNSLLGDGKSAKLLEEGEYGELAKRLRKVAALASTIPGMPEKDVLAEAFESGDELRHYLDALLGYLSVPSPSRARFEKLCAAANALGAPPEAAWPLVTFFPFVAVPTRQMVLLPRSTSAGATRLGCDLQYQAHPNWTTYGRLRDLGARLLEALAARGARDLVDVECFLHATGARRPPTKRARAAKPSPEPKSPRAASRRKP